MKCGMDPEKVIAFSVDKSFHLELFSNKLKKETKIKMKLKQKESLNKNKGNLLRVKVQNNNG